MRKILLIVFLVVVIGGAGWYLYKKQHQTQQGVPSLTDFSSFFPIGDQTTPQEAPGVLPTAPAQTATSTASSSNTPFQQVSAGAVAGYTVFTRSITTPVQSSSSTKSKTQTTTQSVLRYVARDSGYVYEVTPGTVPLQITNVYIPNIYEAFFGDKDASTALLRFLRDDDRTIATYSVPIPPPNSDGTRTQKQGTYLSDNITTLAIAPDGSSIARIVDDASGASLQTTSMTGGKVATLLKNPFQEWLLSWPSQKTLYLQTKPSAQVPGYLYKVDTSEKKLRRVLGDIDGLTASVSPSRTFILYSQYAPNGFITKLLNTKTNTTTTLALDILPEKCTWLKNEDLICAGNTSVPTAEYPDAWYQGVVHFSDNLYHIYTGSVLYDTIATPEGQSFDMTNLSADETNRVVYFVDKNTGILWHTTY